MYSSTGSCKFLQTVVTDNFFANSWFGIFFAIYNNCHSGQIVCKFCKLGFPDKFTRWSRWPGRSGWAFDWFYVIFYVTFYRDFFIIWFPFNLRERNASVAVEFATRHTPLRSLSQLSMLENFFILCISISLVCKDFFFYPRSVLLLLLPKKLDLTYCLI